MKSRNVVLVMLLMAVGGIPVLSAATAKPTPKPGAAITVVGKLTKGVECQALREDKTNKIFTLTPRPPKQFKNGQHVKVSGNTVDVSICQQGTTIAVKTIVKVK